MIQFDYDKFRHRDQDEEFWNQLFNICRRNIRLLAFRRNWPAALYSLEHNSWNERAINDVTTDFIFEHLVAKHKLEYLLDRCSNFIWFNRLLNLMIVQYMADRARKLSSYSEENHLRGKLQTLLQEDDNFRLFTGKSLTGKADWLWGLASKDYSDGYPADIDALKQAALIHPALKRITYKEDSKKMDEIVKKSDLKRLVVHILKSLDRAVLFRDLFEAVKTRVSIDECTTIFTEDDETFYDNSLSSTNNFASELAATYLKGCNDQERLSLYAYFCITEPGKGTEFIKENLTVKKSQARNYINNEKKALEDFIKKTDLTPEEAESFLKNLRLLLESSIDF